MSNTKRSMRKRTPFTAGIDWASADHAVAVLDAAGVQQDRFLIPHTGAGLNQLVRRLRRTGVGEVAIERPDGPVVDALLEAELTVFVIAPNRLKNLRSRYGSAGNKDDNFDAYVLADTLRTDRPRLHPLTRDSDAVMTLRMTVRARQALVAARVAMANQLRAHLQTTLPGAIGLFRDIDSAITLAFLPRFPSQDKTDWFSRTKVGQLAALDRLQPPRQARPTLVPPRQRTRRHPRTPRSRSPSPDHPGNGRGTRGATSPDQGSGGTDRLPSSPATPTPRSSPLCPDPAPSAPPGSWPRSATPAAATRHQNPWSVWPVPHPRLSNQARSKPSLSAGRWTTSCAAPWSTSPATATTPTPGPPTSTNAPAPATTTTPTPCGSWPEHGST